MKSSATPARRALLILGMHRSGTSAAARVVNLLGAELGGDLVPADSDNPKGFWEHAEAVRINEAILHGLGRTWYDMREMPSGWSASELAQSVMPRIVGLIEREFAGSGLCAIKDPRMCLTAPLWIDAFESAGFEVACLIVVRDPREVVASLHCRNAWPRAPLYLMWVQYLMEAFAAAKPRRRAVIAYEQVVADWRGSMTRVARELKLAWPAFADGAVTAAVDAFIDPARRHHHGGTSTADGQDSVVPGLADSLYQTCREIAAGRNEWAALAKAHKSFREAAPLYAAHINQLSTERWNAEERAQSATAVAADHAAGNASVRSDIRQMQTGLDARLAMLEQTMARMVEQTGCVAAQVAATAAVREAVRQLAHTVDARLGTLEGAMTGVAGQVRAAAEESSARSVETTARLERHREGLMTVEARIQRQHALLNTLALRLEQATGSERADPTSGASVVARLGAVDERDGGEAHKLQSALAASNATITSLLSSTSWKLTAPVRWMAVHFLRRPPPTAEPVAPAPVASGVPARRPAGVLAAARSFRS